MTPSQSAPYEPKYYPLHIALLTCGENLMPMGSWLVISKEPFRFIIAMQKGNHTLTLLRKYGEAALHFMPWRERERVVRAGYMSGSFTDKARKLGFILRPAEKLVHTRLVEGADNIFETVVLQELADLSHEYVPFVLEVVAVHGEALPAQREPILFLNEYDFATLGERWRFRR